ncbi:Ppx/GppA family phosphatase [Mesorhizobium sp. M1148]|uniref:Ppx/GppA phosphatase family protein n=1 Tax=unclassified Mesorhizobium TaxID=325217 RepID=UPI0003CEE59A|nr:MULTISPECIES: Ppx/GppA phosphatase family protein [unclassified Mesorhizobium]ESX16940.1 exopolyphosphatase [Mesorhizobium sp. LSJC255A00]ESX23393.1 exopolyphosphatase [Mesorhizobium sp. LSHC440B00]ESX34033.1 exopolyphosphatase [Mesorhizobium sp. LSHC432A00]ESX71802.1 exopolyphosphatase [Mesorhizobium sp. LSHC414A00]WJI56144.1 Ppx/GppA family phosphatase [Mesorhizobium sp. C432A]
MEDHDTGAGAPEVGVSRASPPSGGPSPSAGRPRQAGPQSGNGQAGDAQHQRGKARKRRKRRRGRKVFARDDSPLATAAAVGAPASVGPAAPAPVPLPSAPQPRPEQPMHRPPMQELPVFAALDLGTNNCRLLVAVPQRHGQFRVIDAFSRIVRLGEGLTANGHLSQAAMDRAVEALKICGDKLRNRKIRKARLIATEACRTADNGVEFLQRVEREAGLKLEIIDRQTEARLAVSGCGSLVERDTQGVVLFDIGGGSSEIALIDLIGQRSPRLANHIVSWTSLPVGVVSLAERFGGRTVTREIFAAMVDDVAVRLKSFDGRDRLSHVLASPKFHLLGTSGTVTTLAGVHLDLERYDRRRVDGLWMDRDSVDRMVEKLVGWDFQQRCANPCIGADRADLVLAGCAILEAIRAVWPSERLRVADRGLREGILSELMADDGVWRNSGRGRQ